MDARHAWFCRNVRRMAADFYADPANEVAYQEWLREREGRAQSPNVARPQKERRNPSCKG